MSSIPIAQHTLLPITLQGIAESSMIEKPYSSFHYIIACRQNYERTTQFRLELAADNKMEMCIRKVVRVEREVEKAQL